MSKLPDWQIRILERESVGCRDVRRLLGEVMDEEVIPSLEGRLKSHIDSCEECRRFEQSYRETVDLARDLPLPALSIDAQNRLRQALNRRLGISLPPIPNC